MLLQVELGKYEMWEENKLNLEKYPVSLFPHPSSAPERTYSINISISKYWCQLEIEYYKHLFACQFNQKHRVKYTHIGMVFVQKALL